MYQPMSPLKETWCKIKKKCFCLFNTIQIFHFETPSNRKKEQKQLGEKKKNVNA